MAPYDLNMTMLTKYFVPKVTLLPLLIHETREKTTMPMTYFFFLPQQQRRLQNHQQQQRIEKFQRSSQFHPSPAARFRPFLHESRR